MERDEKTQLLLDMQEHPELYSELALTTMLKDPEVSELMEAAAGLKQAMTWEEHGSGVVTRHSSFQKMAASFIGALLVSGIAFAAIHMVSQHQKEAPQTADTVAVANASPVTRHSSLPEDTVAMQPVVFDNIPLEKMLPEIAAHYHAKVTFANAEARGLRFRFVWNPQQGLDQVISDLNQFERLAVTLKDNHITIE